MSLARSVPRDCLEIVARLRPGADIILLVEHGLARIERAEATKMCDLRVIYNLSPQSALNSLLRLFNDKSTALRHLCKAVTNFYELNPVPFCLNCCFEFSYR